MPPNPELEKPFVWRKLTAMREDVEMQEFSVQRSPPPAALLFPASARTGRVDGA